MGCGSVSCMDQASLSLYFHGLGTIFIYNG